jgi:hypothetical protein
MSNIKADLIFEILGRPAEQLKTALNSLLEKLGNEKGIRVIEKKVHEPTEVKETKDVYTTFAEVSAEFNAIENLLGVLFAYMPAHVEIISPANFDITNIHLNDLSNKLLSRLHNYDAITKKFIYERDFLLEKLKEVAPQLFQKPELSVEENLEKKENSKEEQDVKDKTPQKEKKSKKQS